MSLSLPEVLGLQQRREQELPGVRGKRKVPGAPPGRVGVFQGLELFFPDFCCAPDFSRQLPEEWTLASHWMAPLPAAPLHNDLLEP